jgi:ferredoxin-NADP reductase
LQFDRLEAAPAARCTSRTQGNVGKDTEEVLMADQTATLIRREEVAEGTMASHFEKPSGFSFRAGQFADVTLTDPLETDAKGTPAHFPSRAPFADGLVFVTRMRDTAFKRSLKEVTLTAKVKISPAAGSFTLHKNLAKPAIFLAGGIGITPFLSIVQQADRDRLSQKLYLFYSNRRPEDAAFLDTLRALETTNPNFRLICIMTEMSKSKKEWKGETRESRGYAELVRCCVIIHRFSHGPKRAWQPFSARCLCGFQRCDFWAFSYDNCELA